MKNEPRATTSPAISTSTAYTTDLAASMPARRGTASSDDRISPEEYSLEMIRTPSTQMASCPKPSPVPRMVATGSATVCARCSGRACDQLAAISHEISPVKPRVTTTKTTSDQMVERTD